jgi:sec-independent protein translocase protein TatC
MFLMGAVFSYYIVVPFGFEFLVNFGSQVVAVTPSIGAYVTFFIKIVFGFGIAFELPVITFFFAVIGVVNDRMMKDFFRYAVVFIFVPFSTSYSTRCCHSIFNGCSFDFTLWNLYLHSSNL